MINSIIKCKKVYKTIDIGKYKYYIKSNIPVRPLPKGKLNYGGFFNFRKCDAVYLKTTNREIGMWGGVK
jgi:hypothetical protein